MTPASLSDVAGTTAGPAETPALSILYAECASGNATRRSLAVAYAMLLGAYAGQEAVDLSAAHTAMCEALSTNIFGLDKVKHAGWRIYDATVERRAALSRAASRPTTSGEPT